MEILLYLLGPVLLGFLVQFFIGIRTKRKILRYIPLYGFGLTLIFAVIALRADPGFFIGGNIIAALFWIVIGVCLLVGYALAFLILKIM